MITVRRRQAGDMSGWLSIWVKADDGVTLWWASIILLHCIPNQTRNYYISNAHRRIHSKLPSVDGPDRPDDNDPDSSLGGCHDGDLDCDFALAYGHCTFHLRRPDALVPDFGFASA